ncbi:fatty acid desaturase family protein [Marisediminicola antarctica]|uniref:Delta fatty acid desaturase n=1 Tax=Marisediminicola antarctica TaxID=674079 RepID=A0A7L5AFY5_9MICO|nr:acyl-CoA desaturase [Marisediminicola antarctica]QHO69410.1 delta fatty acid desaturase [Marisediminicola antarctica]
MTDLTASAAHASPSAQRGSSGASEFLGLSKQVKEAGLLRRRYGYYWTALISLPIAYTASLLLFIWIGDSWWQLLTAVGFAVLFTQTAFLGHDAAHRQIFRSGKWNDWTSLVIADLFVGMSYGWWQRKHTRHHANPNKEGADPDINLPIIAITPAQASARRSRVARWLIAHQGWFFFPILAFEGLSMHASGIRRVLSREPVARRWVEIAFITTRLGGFATAVFLVLSPGKAAAFLGIQLALFGFYMGMSFAPNHKGMPIVSKSLKLDFLRRQVMMSRDIRGGLLVDVGMGGLNYQIEHHLFPSMPRPHLRRAAPIVAAYCRARGIPYTQTGLVESYRIVVRYINSAGLGERDPFSCPLVAQRQALG